MKEVHSYNNVSINNNNNNNNIYIHIYIYMYMFVWLAYIWGDAILVPEMVLVATDDPIQVERISRPGA